MKKALQTLGKNLQAASHKTAIITNKGSNLHIFNEA